MSKLNTIMQKQAELQNRVDDRYLSNDPSVKAEYMRDHLVYLVQELNEALYEMPFFKRWKDYSGMTDADMVEAWDKVRMELVDSLHFFVNLLLCAGMTADDVYRMYMAKNAENHRRQDEGYTADVNYKDQSVDEVMRAEATCTIVMGDEIVGSNDFAAVLIKPDGGASVLYDTDVVSMALAAKLLSIECIRLVKEMSEEDQAKLKAVIDELQPIAGGTDNE